MAAWKPAPACAAHARRAVVGLDLDIDGYDFPMQFWVQAAAKKLRIAEIPVRLIYNDPTRSFGGPLDQSDNRLASYRSTIQRELNRCEDELPMLKLNG